MDVTWCVHLIHMALHIYLFTDIMPCHTFLEQQERAGDELSTGYLNEKIDVYALGKHQEKPLRVISKKSRI